jgi:hypothetical protein
MDTTDLQKLIEVIAAQISAAQPTAITPDVTADAVTQETPAVTRPTPASDAGRAVAELLAAMPVAGSSGSAPTQPLAGSSDAENSGALAGVARSLVTGLGVVSLVKGLFGGQDGAAPAPPPLPKFELPLRVQQDIAYSSRTGEYVAVDRPEAGGLRARDAVAPAVTVNVQAMDSKSFLDHSHEIARAVREAILNSNALNDVMAEL